MLYYRYEKDSTVKNAVMAQTPEERQAEKAARLAELERMKEESRLVAEEYAALRKALRDSMK